MAARYETVIRLKSRLLVRTDIQSENQSVRTYRQKPYSCFREHRARLGKAWVWWIAGSAAVLLACAIVLILYNNRARLTQAKLEAARARWEAAGIQDYDIQVNVTGGTSGAYDLQVRRGDVVKATFNGIPFENLEKAQPWTMPELFRILEQDLENDAKPGSPVVFTRVEFDPQDGHLVRYVRSRSGQNVIIQVHLSQVTKVRA